LKAAKRKVAIRAKSVRKKAAAKRAKPRKAAKRKAARKTTRKKGRSTAAGMRLALKMKREAEQAAPPRLDPTPRSPSPSLSQPKPNPVPENPHEQGNTANIEQNTTARGLSR
jgi:hypothetical protein